MTDYSQSISLPVISYLCSQNGSKACWMKCLNQALQEKGNIVKKNILIQTNLLVCSIIVVGFLLTTILSYRANFSSSLENIQQVSDLTSEGIYYQISTTFNKPVNISLTMANDSLLHDVLIQEKERMDDPDFIRTIREYLSTYQEKYGYDSVFLVSAATSRYYNFNGLDRILTPDDPENFWYFDSLLGSDEDYTMNVNNDQVEGAGNAITVFVNCKVRDSAGEFLGVVGVGVRIDGLQRTLQDYQNQFGINSYLIDDEGIIELSIQYSGYENVNLFEMNTISGAQSRQNILDWKDSDALRFWDQNALGQKRNYIVSRYLPEIQWHLVVERDTSILLTRLNQQFVLTACILAVILIIILIVITRVIRRFNRQIIDLTHTVEKERQDIFEKATEDLFENIYEIDITHNLPANPATEAYFESLGAPSSCPFDQALRIIAQKQIKEEFRKGYIETFSPEHVLRAYAEGTEKLIYEFMISKDSEQYYWMRITARIVKLESDDSIHMLVYRQNIDTEKRREQKMQLLAQTDEMTGLLTKSATRRRIDELLEEYPDEYFAYFIFDIDNFKQANDQFGHAFGDTVIRSFTQTLFEYFRKDDTLGRIGGDEFVAFVRGVDYAGAMERAERLSLALCRTHISGSISWKLSASIGVVLSPGNTTDAETLFKNADTALYQTKKRGKNGYTIFEENCSGS